MGLFASSAQAALRAGVSVVDISPTEFPVIVNGNFLPGKATEVHDPIHARVLVLDDGTNRLAICVVDSCVLPAELTNEVKSRVTKLASIPVDRIVISATHAHSCPSAMAALGVDVDPHYPALLKDKLVEAIAAATKELVPAKVAWGVANASPYTAARRWIRRSDRIMRDPYGELTLHANMHPGFQSPDAIGPSGPIDPDLTVLSVQTTDGAPLALLANFGMHYFATGVKPISSDYYGPFCDKVAARLNADKFVKGRPKFVAMLSQGCSGDMWRTNYEEPKPATPITLDQFASDLSKLAVQAVAHAEYRADVSLAMAETKIRVKARLADEKRTTWAKETLASMGDRPPKNTSEVLAREVVYLAQRPEADMILQAIRIGDFGIVTMPNEVYALTGLKIKAASPLPGTMCIELANDELGYIPPPEQHKLGGYTTWAARSSYTAVDTEPRMVDTIIGLLEQVTNKKRREWATPAGAYATSVLSSRPSAYWRTGEMRGADAIDASGNNIAGHYEDGVVFYLPGPNSPAFCGEHYVHRAAHFCGGRMTADVPALGKAATYSAEFWFWNGFPGEGRSVAGYLFGRGAAGAQTDADRLGIGGTEPLGGADGKNHLFFSAGAGKQPLIGRSTLTLHTWNHVVLVREGRRATVYLNGGGEPEIIGDAEAAPPKDSHVYFGGAVDPALSLEGKMDEAAVYDRAIPRDEATGHYHAAAFEAGGPTEAAPAHTNVTPTKPVPAEEAVKHLKLAKGFQAELMVSEPLLTSPVAMAFGHDGKLWIVEMTEYPLGKKGTMDPSGRVIYLESSKGDGKYDKLTVFAENLNFPNGILPWRNGVIVTSAPDIFYLESTTGVGKADKKEVLYTGFTQGNPQLRINSPTYGLDNWVHLANGLKSQDLARSIRTGMSVNMSNHDCRIKPDEGLIEPETGVSQYGKHMDNWGTWFGVHNSFPVRHFVIPDYYANRNKQVQAPRGWDDSQLPPNPKVYPVSAGQKRYGFAFFEQAGHFTSACSAIPYRDDLLFGPLDPTTGLDHLFVCEPAHNLIQHLVLSPTGTSFAALRAPGEEFSDFAASDDGWSRPCYLASAPDGALWFVDIYRFFIDHPDFLPPEGKQDMRPFYRLGENMGRILRIYPEGKKPRAIPNLSKLDAPALVTALDSSSGWQRDTAQMMLVWRKDPAAITPLKELASHSKNPYARLHAMCTLDGLQQLSSELLTALLHDDNPAVRRHAVRLAETYAKQSPALIAAAASLAHDPSPVVRQQLAFTLGEWSAPEAGTALGTIAVDAGDDVYLSAAVMSSASQHYPAIAEALIKAGKAGPMTRDLLAMALANSNRDLAAKLLAPVFATRDGRYSAEQMEAFGRFIDDLAVRHTSPEKLASLNKDDLAGQLAHADKLFDAARSTAGEAKAVPGERVSAAALLGRQPARYADDIPRLSALVGYPAPAPLQIAAIRSLARIDRDDVPPALLGRWKQADPDARKAILDAIIAREPWAFALLKQVESHDFAGVDIDPSRRQRLIRHTSARVRELADKTIGESSALSRTKVLENYHPVLAMSGDPKLGQKVFVANCSTCHRLENVGNEIGPNLTSVAHWPVEALMVAILDPSRSAEPRYLGFNCVLDTGETVYGLVVSESTAGVTIKGIDSKDRLIPRAQIRSLDCTNRSLMPDGLEAAIDKQALADLIAYIHTQGR